MAVTTVVVQESGLVQSFHFVADEVVLVLLLLVVEVLLAGSQPLHDGSQAVLLVLDNDLGVVVVVLEEVVLVVLEDQPSQPWAEARPATAAMTETEYFILTPVSKVLKLLLMKVR